MNFLRELTEKIGSGATPRGGKNAYKGGNFSLIRSQNVLDFQFSFDGLAKINDEQAKALSNVEVLEGDVLLNITGDSVARCCQVDVMSLPARVNQHVCIIRPKRDKLDPRFLKYLLLEPNYKNYLLTLASAGATRNALTKGMVEELEIPKVDITDQKAIAQILGTLDDKIELNREMNQTLEEMAKAIFKSWFVDFDPVRAKVEGRPTGLPNEISDLFPDKMVDSEIGEIPKSWDVGSISDLACLNKKTVNPSQSEEMYEHFSIPAFDSGQSPVLDLGTDIKSNKTLVVEGSLLVSKLNPDTPRVWLPNPKDLYEQICSTEFMVFTATDCSNIAFLWGLFTSSKVAERMEAMVTGTSKSHQRVKPNDVSNMTIIKPDVRIIETYRDKVLPMLNRTLVGKSQSNVVAGLRDALLPKLISGELRIPDAEKFLEEADI